MTDPSYIFGHGGREVETRRLDQLEALLDDRTFARLDPLVERGDRCLEIAAGRGTAALRMLTRCGATGEVVATDIDTHWIEAYQHPNYRAVRHDILADSLDELGQFDVVHVRFLLHHLGRERGALALQRCVQLLKPGGRLLAEEPMGPARGDPGNPQSAALEVLVQQFQAFLAARVGFDPDFGLTLPRLLVENGLTDVHNDVHGSLSTLGDVFNTWFNSSIDSARPVLDLAFEDGGEQLIDVINRPGLWSTVWLVVSAWGSLPMS